MPDHTPRSGVVNAALLALADPVFFLRLLEDPRAAVAERHLEITEDELEHLQEIVAHGRAQLGPNEALELWRGFHAIGTWDPKGWQGEWRPPARPGPGPDPSPVQPYS